MSAFTGEMKRAKASSIPGSSQVNVRVDYVDEMAVITAGSGNSTKFYFSTDNQKSWVFIDAGLAMDISAFLQKKSTTVYFKGNRDTNPTPVVLQGEETSLKAAYKVVNGEGTIALTGATGQVEYRKGANGYWKTVNGSISTAIYEMTGTTLYFRTAATTAKRAGTTVSVKVPKKSSAPTVKLDGSKFIITGLKYDETQYRIGNNTNWITFKPDDKKIRTLDLVALIGTSAITNAPIPAGVIEFRTKASDKKVSSYVKIIEIPSQPVIPDTVRLIGTTLSILDSDLKRAYEYTKVAKDSYLNINTARWSSITAARSVIIPKLSVGDKVYVRLKSTTDRVTKIVTPASTYRELPVTSITVKK
jgi:hypothetical protein